jgi:hypothetical protein
MTSNQINQYKQSETEEIYPISAHFHDLMNHCCSSLAPMLTELTINILEAFPKESQKKAVDSGKFQEWHLLEESIRAIEQHHEKIVSRYSNNITFAFNQFIRGETIDSGYIGDNDSDLTSQIEALSLIDNEEMEISVLITTIATGASHHYTDELYALGRRLAMINHGNLVDDQEKSFLLGPSHLCHAFLDAIQISQLESHGEQALLNAFQQHVINKLDPVYKQFNTLLVEAGVLPNITYTSVKSTAQNGFQSSDEDVVADDVISEQPQADLTQGYQPSAGQSKIRNAVQQDVMQGIMALLSERREIQSAAGIVAPAQHISSQQVQQRRDHLVSTIGTMQQSVNPAMLADAADFSIDTARAQIQHQTTQIAKEVAEIQPDTADADLIDMVGMLFEFILDDDDLPDNIKALLCHLHTPYLKVALLDRQMFMEIDHPARLLLDALSQAGSLCADNNKNTLNIIAQIRETIKCVLERFDKEAELFEELLELFKASMEKINRRHSVVQKRSVDAAKGQQKIKKAREIVSHTVIDQLIKHPQIPKIMESILMGSWGNYLMITLLRNGQSSQEWQLAIKLTDDLIWSVEPKHTIEERDQLKKQLPKIVADTRNAFKLSGNTEDEEEVLIGKLQKCHELVLLGYYTKVDASTSNVPGDSNRLNTLSRIMPEEWKESFKQRKRAADISPETKALFSLGTRVEINKPEQEKLIRGRIAWTNEDGTQCLLVNESGKQIAIQSVDELNQARIDGTLKILKEQDQPLFDRAMGWIQERIRQETKVAITT